MNSGSHESRRWRYLKGLGPPLLLFALLMSALIYALQFRLRGEEQYDDTILREWIEEARAFRYSLPELIRDYFQSVEQGLDPIQMQHRWESMQEHLMTLGEVTRAYQTQLPLFPLVYRMELTLLPMQATLAWDSQMPMRPGQVEQRQLVLHDTGLQKAILTIQFQLHAYAQRQEAIAAQEIRLRSWLSLLAFLAAVLAMLWILAFMRGEQRRDWEKYQARRELEEQERQTLEEKIRREQAEREREESERKLLEVKLQSQEAERQALTLKSQLYANIGIMAGSYAHNIKNMMVRPNDLIQRCMAHPKLDHDVKGLLQEMRQTLHAVTERTQQILNTVKRDPTRAELKPLDLARLLREIFQAWVSMSSQKWKIELQLDLAEQELMLEGDASHLTQALENLLFNARDAIFEMRSQLREAARAKVSDHPEEQKQALISAAAWHGRIELKAFRKDDRIHVRVVDNGVGMTEEIQQKCTDTNFSTKRNNAWYEGLNTGMGLGLSFVKAVLESHHGELHIRSSPGQGAAFELTFPAMSSTGRS